jgi:hypothetical protein
VGRLRLFAALLLTSSGQRGDGRQDRQDSTGLVAHGFPLSSKHYFVGWFAYPTVLQQNAELAVSNFIARGSEVVGPAGDVDAFGP